MKFDRWLFNFDDKEIEVFVDEDGNPWLPTEVILPILKIKNNIKVLLKIDASGEKADIGEKGDKPKVKLGMMNISGLYWLRTHHKKPQVRKFVHWVERDVLPVIEKVYGYVYDVNGKCYDEIRYEISKLKKDDILWSHGSRTDGATGLNVDWVSETEFEDHALQIAKRTLYKRNLRIALPWNDNSTDSEDDYVHLPKLNLTEFLAYGLIQADILTKTIKAENAIKNADIATTKAEIAMKEFEQSVMYEPTSDTQYPAYLN